MGSASDTPGGDQSYEQRPDVARRFNLLSDNLVRLDDAKAAAHLALPVFDEERNVKPQHVETLLGCVLRGEFNAHEVTLAIGVLDGVRYRVNGGHTATMTRRMHERSPGWHMHVREQIYLCQTKDELLALYASFDRCLSRTKQHCTRVLMSGTPELADIPARVFDRMCPGFKIWLFTSSAAREQLSEHQLCEIIRARLSLTRTVGLFFREHEGHLLRRGPVFAAMLATFDKDMRAGQEFWTAVATGLGLTEESDPRYRLRATLEHTVLHASRHAKRARVVDEETLYKICLHAWNKWRTGGSCPGVLRAPSERPEIQ